MGTESAVGPSEEGLANSCLQAPSAPPVDTGHSAGAVAAVGRAAHAAPAVPEHAVVLGASNTIADSR